MKKMLTFLTALLIIISCSASIAESYPTKSPYEKWLEQKYVPEAGEVYNSYISVLKDIKDGLKTGKVGTNKYKAAVEVLVPYGEDVKKYVKKLERYITSDADGVNNFIDDLTKHGFMKSYPDGRYKTTENVTVEAVAEKLTLKYEVVEAIFYALKDYGGDVNLEKKEYY